VLSGDSPWTPKNAPFMCSQTARCTVSCSSVNAVNRAPALEAVEAAEVGGDLEFSALGLTDRLERLGLCQRDRRARGPGRDEQGDDGHEHGGEHLALTRSCISSSLELARPA